VGLRNRLERARLHDAAVPDGLPHERRSVLLYFPDCERFLADTAIEIVEIKKTEEELSREPDYGFKLWLARRVCEKRGWIFSTFVADKDFVKGHLLANARRIRMNRTTTVSSEDFIRLGEASRAPAAR